MYFADSGEPFAYFVFTGAPGKVSDINLLHNTNLPCVRIGSGLTSKNEAPYRSGVRTRSRLNPNEHHARTGCASKRFAKSGLLRKKLNDHRSSGLFTKPEKRRKFGPPPPQGPLQARGTGPLPPRAGYRDPPRFAQRPIAPRARNDTSLPGPVTLRARIGAGASLRESGMRVCESGTRVPNR